MESVGRGCWVFWCQVEGGGDSVHPHLENIPEFSLVPPEKVQLLIVVISVLELGCMNNSCGEIIDRLKLLICKVQET